MKKRKLGGEFTYAGVIIFFITIALIIQIAVLIYDYIIQRTTDKALIAVLMLGVIAILAVLCTVVDVIRRRITIDRPVKKILTATERIAKGDFSVRLDIQSPYGRYSHYDVIMENINVLAAELGKSEVLKTDFIANVSHELKTPLSVLQNYAALLQDSGLDEETRQRYAKTLSRAAKRLSDLITNILKLNKLENQEIKPEFERFSLTEQLAQAALAFEEVIENKNLVLDCDLDDIQIVSAPSLLEIVWNNLLSNAIKFTEAGDIIGLSLKVKGGAAVVTVSDSGCGISKETGAHIFEKFYQGDTSHSGEGNGLGLPLVKKVIDILGGEISVASEVGKGSAFTIVLKGNVYA
ncbi:MAG: HAMP domain-containing histidine kinase [Clostridia bacterium]|nr:HAMP domain-containing histidine kinase [Clostridia bacterium]